MGERRCRKHGDQAKRFPRRRFWHDRLPHSLVSLTPSAFSSYKFRYSLLGVRIPAAFKRMAALRSVLPVARGAPVKFADHSVYALVGLPAWETTCSGNTDGYELRKRFQLQTFPNRWCGPGS